MDKESIINLQEEKFQNLFDWLDNQPEKNWEKGPEGKWTTGQQVLHLVQSMKPLNKALRIPKFILGYKFGKSNRALRDYNTVVKRYHDRLAESKDVVISFNKDLKKPSLKERKQLIAALKDQNKKLQSIIKKWSDKNLDNYILPHPLMGKMPVREIIMWSAYHIEHHTNILNEKY